MRSHWSSRVGAKSQQARRIFHAYRHEAETFRDFLLLCQVRLAQSRWVGKIVCPRPRQRTINIKSFGGPVVLRTHTTDISVNDELIVYGGYRHLTGSQVRTPRVIVDLGANIGLVTRWLAQAYPSARLVAVEPEPGNLAVLTANIAPIRDRVFLAPLAVSSAAGRGRVVSDSGEHGYTLVSESAAAAGAGGEVTVSTLESVLSSAKVDEIDILKCDIEGSERELFASCANWIQRVGTIEIECHEPYTLEQLQDDLVANGGTFDVLERQPNPGYHCEVALLRQPRLAVDTDHGNTVLGQADR